MPGGRLASGGSSSRCVPSTARVLRGPAARARRLTLGPPVLLDPARHPARDLRPRARRRVWRGRQAPGREGGGAARGRAGRRRRRGGQEGQEGARERGPKRWPAADAQEPQAKERGRPWPDGLHGGLRPSRCVVPTYPPRPGAPLPLTPRSPSVSFRATGALYLHPLALQLQLRPSLDYLTALDERSKEERRRERAGEGDDDSDDEKKEEVAKAVAVRPLWRLARLRAQAQEADYDRSSSSLPGDGQARAGRRPCPRRKHQHPGAPDRVRGAVGQDGLARHWRASLSSLRHCLVFADAFAFPSLRAWDKQSEHSDAVRDAIFDGPSDELASTTRAVDLLESKPVGPSARWA